MSTPNQTCPYCGHQHAPNTPFCAHCGNRLDSDPFRPVDFLGPPANLRIPHPHLSGLIALVGPIILFLFPALLAVFLLATGQSDHPLFVPALIGLGLFILFVLSWLAAWLIGLRQKGQIRRFLTGNRPLVRWNYTPEEWRQIREAYRQETKGDWAVQVGCLTALFAVIGLLVGAMIGLAEGTIEMIWYGFGGGFLGLLAGGAIGGAVAGGNYLAARQTYRRQEPGIVALGRHEVYANDQYFRGNGRDKRIRRAGLATGDPNILSIEMEGLFRPRGPSEEEWLIMVPPRLVKVVKEVIPRLTGQDNAPNKE